uniref:Uncharacterized protein n=2 Tax=Oryza TaxID=4527 RepID=A0A0D3G6M4_9ORYZ
MSSISYFLVAMLLCDGFGFIVFAQVVGGGSSSGIPSFVGIDGGSNVIGVGKRLTPTGPNPVHNEFQPPPPPPPPSPPNGGNVIGDGKRLTPTGLDPVHNLFQPPPPSPPNGMIE